MILMSSSLQADSLQTEIQSGQYCKSDLFKQFQKIEQSGHQRLEFQPKPKLMEFVTQMELMCPWESQRDFNGDKRLDWIGFSKLGTEYELVAYLSSGNTFKVQKIEASTTKPSNSFIRWVQTRQLSNFTKKTLPIGQLKYALQVSDLEGMTNFYLWDGKTMAKVLTTSQIF